MHKQMKIVFYQMKSSETSQLIYLLPIFHFFNNIYLLTKMNNP